MKQHELRPPRGAVKARKRVGRGAGSGHGKTSGRGMSGQRSRSNIGLRPTFEGGQRPITQRMPTKRGFHNPFRIEYTAVNVARLAEVFAAGATVTPESLYEMRVVRNLNHPIKILGQGELAAALNIHAHAFSETARAKIIAAGGTCTVLDLQVLEAATGEAPSESA